jgi:APA family basic amino acid/polyamine antiporter
MSRTATVARVLLGLTLLVLGVVVALAWTSAAGSRPVQELELHGGAYGVLQSAGLLFFAFAGYARIATLAEEVRRPEQLGRAVLLALGVAIALYVAVAVALLAVLGSEGLADAATPLVTAVDTAGAGWAVPAVRVGAAAAALGALLALLAGVSRTTLAMARERDLPPPLAAVDPVHQVPRRAQLAVAVAVVALVLVTDLRGAIGFSSTGVLLYYAVANLSALRQPAAQRRWPRGVNVLGLVGCLTLVATLPATSLLAGLGVLAVGVLGRLLIRGR